MFVEKIKEKGTQSLKKIKNLEEVLKEKPCEAYFNCSLEEIGYKDGISERVNKHNEHESKKVNKNLSNSYIRMCMLLLKISGGWRITER